MLPLAVRRHKLIFEIEQGLLRCGVPLDDESSPRGPIPLIIGVSGGADSVSLLLGCVAISQRSSHKRLVPIAVHVHHHLRESADADAEFVAGFCQQLQVRVHVRHVHPSELPGNCSANARRLRYQALCEVAISEGAQFIAVAHHGEDQLETMIASLCRGAGLEGLAGMPWSRTLEECCEHAAEMKEQLLNKHGRGLRLIRPLLALRRADCESLCVAAGVKWQEDPSNLDLTKARARLRSEVLPVLEELWPQAPRRVTATSEILASAIAAANQAMNQAFGSPTNTQWDRTALAGVPQPILAAGLRRAALSLVPKAADELNQRHLIQVAAQIVSSDRRPHQFHWPCHLLVCITSKQVSMAQSIGSS